MLGSDQSMKSVIGHGREQLHFNLKSKPMGD